MLELVKIDTIKQELDAYRKDIISVLLYADGLEVTDSDEAKQAIDYVAKARKLRKTISEKKLELTASARAFVKQINSMADEFLEPLSQVERKIADEIDAWKNGTKEEIEELDFFDADAVPTFEDNSRIKSSLASCKEITKYKIDVEALSLVPSEYLMLDEEKIQLAIKRGVRTIPGVSITAFKQTIIRRK